MKTERELEKAIDAYSDMIRRICFIHVKQEADVEDIFQIVFLKYLKSKQEFFDEEHEKAWLIRVTINSCKDFLGSWFKRKVELTMDFQTFGIEDKSDDGYLLQAVRNLPYKYRTIIYLHYYEEYSMKEIASLMNKNENTIYTWHKRAKEMLKQELGGDYFG